MEESEDSGVPVTTCAHEIEEEDFGVREGVGLGLRHGDLVC